MQCRAHDHGPMSARCRITLLTVCLTLHASPAVNAAPSETGAIQVEVFTTAAFPIEPEQLGETSAEVRQYALDGVAKFERRLALGIPADPEDAKEVVLERIGTLTAADSSELKAAADGIALAAQQGVERVPAMVFNREAVVYGDRRVADALNRYRAWRSEQHR